MRKIILSVIVTALFNISVHANPHGGFGTMQPSPHTAPAHDAKPVDTRYTPDQAKEEVIKNQKLLNAIQKVETGGEKDPSKAKGDNGAALGWFQIHRDYWKDAMKASATAMFGDYTHDATELDNARITVVCYWHYCKKQLSDKGKALFHHYGPSGLPGNSKFENDPDGYYVKVQKAMKDQVKK